MKKARARDLGISLPGVPGQFNAITHTKTTIEILGDERMDPLYKAVADATEEAILNALCAAETMTGKKGDTYFAMPGEEVAEMVKASEKLWAASL